MKAQYLWSLIFLNLILLLIYFNVSVNQKETILKEGKLVLLSLAPVDPRSLMQGDYMDLRYEIADSFNIKKDAKRGFCIVTIDSLGVAQNNRFQSALTPLSSEEIPIEYTTNFSDHMVIGAESYFFQEGTAERFDSAKYGGLKVDNYGNSILIGLFDQHQKLIK